MGACLRALLALLSLLPLRAPGAPGAGAAPEVFELDPAQSFVWFEVLHFGTSTLRGRFAGVEGEVTLDRTGGHSYVGLRIPTASVATGIPVLDARLRRADLLASTEYPEAFFVAQQFRFQGAQLAEVRGEFTWRGVSQPLSLLATHFACRLDPAATPAVQVCGGDFEADFQRSGFGASFGLPFVADRVHLVISVEGRQR
jgi:polyisoprenoid-binding protein YceI